MPQYFNFALNKTSIYYDDGVNYNIAAAPLYFVRSGLVILPSTAGTFGYAGVDGYEWSSRAAVYTSSTSATAYYLGFNASTVYPSYGPYERWRGRPLRCLSTVLGMGDCNTSTIS